MGAQTHACKQNKNNIKPNERVATALAPISSHSNNPFPGPKVPYLYSSPATFSSVGTWLLGAEGLTILAPLRSVQFSGFISCKVP